LCAWLIALPYSGFLPHISHASAIVALLHRSEIVDLLANVC
jgi:hypothetical protein